MKKNFLLKTNFIICIIITAGFIITSIISYHSNIGIFKQDIEWVSSLTSEGIYYQIESIFTKPVNISLTMANDSLLKEFLSEEKLRLQDQTFISSMRDYLLAYKNKYSYDSVFLISAQTNRYYHFNGLDRVLTPDDPENIWYYSFLESDQEYSLNIDNDEAADNEITVFINCKIKNSDGNVMGIVGVGFRVDDLQRLLREYETNFNLHAYLINKKGFIEISTDQTGYERADLFESCAYADLKSQIISDKEKPRYFWYKSSQESGFLVTQYVANLDWFLIIDNNLSLLDQKLSRQFLGGILVVVIVILLVLFMITRIIKKYNDKIIEFSITKKQEHQTIFQEVTEKLYENIYELDITHNRAASEATEQYFESLGVPKKTSYDETLKIIAEKQIKEEYRQGYISTFSTVNVLDTYEQGLESLCYDFMISSDGKNYYWMRITARIFYWNEDHSIRMFVYRQNIDAEKKQEKQLLEKMQRDSLSKLYNKAATHNHIQSLLSNHPKKLFAFFILDIDNFKQVNDTFGHAAGDYIISEFSKILKGQFRKEDIIGRIGGDEFVVFIPAPSREWIEKKAQNLILALHHSFLCANELCHVSSSIGIAITPEGGTDFETLYKNADNALYHSKKLGKNRFTIYSKQTSL